MSYSVIVKEDCATCQLVVPVIKQLKEDDELTIYSQDNVQFPSGVSVIDDTQLEYSWRRRIETVPTLIKFNDNGEELARVIGWEKSEWQALTGKPLEFDLPDFRPGCGSKSVDPGMPEKLAARFDRDKLQSRELTISTEEDDMEACFDRGWSDGLPVVPPTNASCVC